MCEGGRMGAQDKSNSATSSSLQIISVKDSLTESRSDSNLFAVKSPTTTSDVSKSSTSTRSVCSDGWSSLLGASQLTLGVGMCVLAVLAILHEASLANVASGLWGGAIAVSAGVAGILAGMHTSSGPRKEPSSALAITVFLAASLIAFAVGNLVLVLAAIGLVRDAQRPSQNSWPNEKLSLIEIDSDENTTNWAPLLANLGLVLVSSLECLAALITSFKCYHLVCPCSKRRLETRHRQLEAMTAVPWIVAGGSKERRIANWVIQHTPNSSANVLLVPSHPQSSRVVTPAFLNPLLLTPPPQTILTARPSHRPSSTLTQGTRKSRQSKGSRYHRRMISTSVGCPEPPPPVQPSPSDEELAKTYTGMDRDLAEEFISIAMDPSVNNSNNASSCADSCASLTTRS